MDYANLLAQWTQCPGLSGNEGGIGQAIAKAFAPYCAVETDAIQNVIARMGEGSGPRVLITAHQDEIGLITTLVEKDGALRFHRIGGVDPRILPGSRVYVHAPGGTLMGVIGALPPHILDAESRTKNYTLDNLFIDLALPAEQVTELVPPGVLVTLDGPVTSLANGRIAAKSLDDRAGVAVMLRVAQLLARRKFTAQVFFVAAAQEEVGSFGARAAAFSLRPDIGVAIDVTHGKTPGSGEDGVFPLDTVVATAGPFIHPKLHAYLFDVAKAEHVELKRSFSTRDTSTDADELQVALSGVPTVLIEIPLKYMHTTVETLAQSTLEEAARLLTAFVTGLDGKEADWLCCWND